ncbi:lamin tail domain-containing protein [Xanthomonas sp. H13-6]|uniref:Lamin tail domain-containing protein n=1 Tax=Xanthomonas chitinilytica TaxID=2989819 RepID=A0ABT3JWL5_9XANT|nr:Calx-beta domain-containing protein [Xanthomonas sp. H13-6]MCW4472876.1 lamin tail domain-containing protein [Xanthomonas sp. H13-6]
MRALLLRSAVVLCALAFAGHGRAQVVVSQVYGGGGNSGATYKSDFIELHNNGSSPVSLAGWSVQYASATGSSWQVTPLAGSIAPGGYYLVKQADGAGGSVDLPAPDASGGIAMSGTAGKVALSNGTAALSGTCPSGTVDLVGFGGTANCAEGDAPTPAPSNTLAVLRKEGGCSDSDNNGADFATGAPTPRNSAAPAHVCGGGGQPVLSVADGSAGESAPVVFLQVSLSQPAGPGGVSVDYATVDGTATAGSDYVARSGTLTLPEGVAGFMLQFELIDDTLVEGNETFHVDFSNISGAVLGTARATATIVDDDFNVLPIHAIQGSGGSSPYAGQVVATSGIVTGRRSAGFFLQMPDAEADNDPRTSEGIYVYTGSAPPAEAAVGNRVTVQGTVLEYVPTADPSQPPLTEITSPTVLFQSAGHPLPTPVTLTPQFPDPDGDYDQLEALEGMRVTVPSLTVNTPTLGNVSEANATGSSNGVFHAVVTGVTRGYRRPGVQQPDPLPAGSPGEVPRWNTNPHVIGVGSAGLGGERIDVAAGCVVSGVTGPLDYGFRRYTIYPEAAPQVDCDGADQPRPAPLPQADDVSVATYNLQRFFDDHNDPSIGEPVLTPAAYQARLNKASLGIRDYLHLPDILGVVEVENLQVLQTLADRIGSDAVAAGQPDPQYVAHLIDGNDIGGIDVGFLVKTAPVAAGLPRVQVELVEQHGKDTTWTEPGGATSLLNDRPPLLLQATVNFADGRQLPLTAIVVHQRSLNGAEADTASGQRIRAKRQAQADFLADLLQARQLADPQEQVLVMGDFNAFEFNDGYVDAMGTVTGLPSADAQTVVAGDGVDRVDPDYDNLTWLLPPDQSYSYAYDGNVQSLDHILANQALMQSPQLETLAIGHARINADFPETARNDADTPTRLSDHDPTVVLLKLKMQRFADLGVAANADPAEVVAGAEAVFTVDVENQGPDAAEHAAVAFVFDAVVAPVLTAAPGWSCAPPQTGAHTTLTCTIASFASGSAQSFTLRVATDAALAGQTLQLAASVRSQTPDPQPGNDGDSTSVAVAAADAANLAVAIDGPATVPATQLTAQYAVTLANHGNLDAQAPTLRLEGNTLAATASVVAPAGWQCRKEGGARQASFDCSGTQPLAAGAQAVFQLKANTRPAPADGLIQVHAAAASASAEADPADNSASFSTRTACSGRGC